MNDSSCFDKTAKKLKGHVATGLTQVSYMIINLNLISKLVLNNADCFD